MTETVTRLTRNPQPATRDIRGFTLIEVVVALAMLAIGLTVIIELFSGGLRLGRISKEYTQAMNYASLKMEEIATRRTIDEGEDTGEFDNNYRWRSGLKRWISFQAIRARISDRLWNSIIFV